jgi:ParB family chromosome partitioning protein
MSDKRRGLGRGLGALIPSAPQTTSSQRPVDVFFPESRPSAPDALSTSSGAASTDTASADPKDQSDGYAAPPAEQASTTPSVPEADTAATTGVADAEGLLPVPGAQYAEIPLDAIRPNPRQPRTVFDEDDLNELVHSIREVGILQPVVVRPIGGADGDADAQDEDADDGIQFELVMGERRWRASRLAGKETVPAIIKGTDDDVLLRDALLENLHRSQLNALEEAAAYQQLLDDFGCTQEELSSRIGRSRPQISNTLRLLKLPPLVARRVAAGGLSAGHARALLGLPDGAAMERLAQRIVAEGMSVRTVEEVVALGGDEEKPVRRRPRPGARHPQLDDLAAELSDQLETRVAIALGQRKGKVTIEFASVEDLHRIIDAMGLQTTRD